MAIQTKASYGGQAKTDVLNGYIRIEDGNNRLRLFDGVLNRLLLGVLPDGSVGLVISKEGIDVFDVFL